MDYTDDIDILIAKALSAETSPEEQAHLDQWVQGSPDNALYYKQMQQLWQRSLEGRSELKSRLDVEAALARTKAKIGQKVAAHPAKTISLNFRWTAIAAALALLIAAVWFFRGGAESPETLLAANQVLRDTLKDGSVISLQQHSSLSASFNGQKRRVKMSGEAYFQVAHDQEKPFVVEVKEVEVTVLGTKFNVDNQSDPNQVKVNVEEGRVKVQSKVQVEYLTAGEQALIDCQSGKITRSAAKLPSNTFAWASRQFYFDDTPLSEVIPMLEKSYNVHIRLSNPALANCRLHVRFNNDEIEKIMPVIAETFSLHLTVTNGQYFLEGEPCGN